MSCERQAVEEGPTTHIEQTRTYEVEGTAPRAREEDEVGRVPVPGDECDQPGGLKERHGSCEWKKEEHQYIYG